MKRNLIICPQCESKGVTQILGELEPNGWFTIQRFHKAFTKVKGSNFGIACSGCDETVFIKEERSNGTLPDNGSLGISGDSSDTTTTTNW